MIMPVSSYPTVPQYLLYGTYHLETVLADSQAFQVTNRYNVPGNEATYITKCKGKIHMAQ